MFNLHEKNARIQNMYNIIQMYKRLFCFVQNIQFLNIEFVHISLIIFLIQAIFNASLGLNLMNKFIIVIYN